MCCIITHDGFPFTLEESFILFNKSQYLPFLNHMLMSASILGTEENLKSDFPFQDGNPFLKVRQMS